MLNNVYSQKYESLDKEHKFGLEIQKAIKQWVSKMEAEPSSS